MKTMAVKGLIKEIRSTHALYFNLSEAKCFVLGINKRFSVNNWDASNTKLLFFFGFFWILTAPALNHLKRW